MVIFEDDVDFETSVFNDSKVHSPESDDSNYFSDEDNSIFDDQKKSNGNSFSLKDEAFSPENLLYRFEGNCSLVIALRKERKVLRILKRSKADNEPLADSENLRKELHRVIDFCGKVLKPKLGNAFITEPWLVFLRTNHVVALNECAKGARPCHRLHKTLPIRESYALLLPDYCSDIRPYNEFSLHLKDFSLFGPVVTIEIKPKQGFLPDSSFLPDNLSAKSSISRFCLKQFHKQRRGSVSGRSKYCPLDLYSGCDVRMRHAILSLFETPQNNLRVFKGSSFVYGEDLRSSLVEVCEESFEVQDEAEALSIISDVLCKVLITPVVENCHKVNHHTAQNCVLHALPSNDNSCSFCGGTKHVVQETSVLGCILNAQRLDSIDSYCALEIALKLQKKYSNLIEDLSNLKLPSDGVLTPDEEDYRRVFEYMVSLTAKDLSIMISVQRITSSEHSDRPARNRNECVVVSAGKGIIIYTDKNGLSFLCRIAVTDLDPKVPSSMAELERKWHEKDLLMVSAFERSDK